MDVYEMHCRDASSHGLHMSVIGFKIIKKIISDPGVDPRHGKKDSAWEPSKTNMLYFWMPAINAVVVLVFQIFQGVDPGRGKNR